MEKKVIINIGRQFGAGGLVVANELGKRLGIPVYDKELITKAAQDSGFSVEFFEQSDEKKRLFSLSSIFANSFSDTENYMSDRGLFKLQSQTITSIAEQGSAVIVGRCADYILRDNPNLISIFIYASNDFRIKNVAKRGNISKNDAQTLINKTDRRRSNYYNFYTGNRWGEMTNYDLSLDASKLGAEEVAEIIANYAKFFEAK